MMLKEIHECIGHLRYEITAKPKRIAFVIYQRAASYRKATKGTNERARRAALLPRTHVSWSTVTLDKLRSIFQTYTHTCALPNPAVNSRLTRPEYDGQTLNFERRYKTWA